MIRRSRPHEGVGVVTFGRVVGELGVTEPLWGKAVSGSDKHRPVILDLAVHIDRVVILYVGNLAELGVAQGIRATDRQHNGIAQCKAVSRVEATGEASVRTRFTGNVARVVGAVMRLAGGHANSETGEVGTVGGESRSGAKRQGEKSGGGDEFQGIPFLWVGRESVLLKCFCTIRGRGDG